MTPASLTLARDGDAAATDTASALWTAITERVAAGYAGTALDLIGQHVGSTTDVPDAVLREAVTRAGLYLVNTEVAIGRREMEIGSIRVLPTSTAANPLRLSGAMSLLLPWTGKRAGAV